MGCARLGNAIKHWNFRLQSTDTVYTDRWCYAGRGAEFHKQLQWLFLADASVCEACQAGEQPWLLAVKYTFTGTNHNDIQACEFSITFTIVSTKSENLLWCNERGVNDELWTCIAVVEVCTRKHCDTNLIPTGAVLLDCRQSGNILQCSPARPTIFSGP